MIRLFFFKLIFIFIYIFKMTSTTMKGLNEFIADIRACKNKDEETKRVELQIAKIRDKFTNQKGLNAYQRKKYVWKLLYIHILGYEIDFGHFESANLINSSKYEEKYTGYIASSLLVNQKNQQIWKSIANSIETDIRSRNANAQSLAFSMVGTLAPEALVNTLSEQIVDVAISPKYDIVVRKKAILCLLRILKKYPQKFDTKKWVNSIAEMFETKYIVLSFLNSAASLLLGIFTVTSPELFKQILPKVVRLLHKLAISKQCSLDYLYYQTPNPWLQIKLFKLLQNWNAPEDKNVISMTEEILSKILKRTDATKSINKNNTDYGILFEAINVIIHYDKKLTSNLLSDVSKILVIFIQSSQANIKYLGLEAMCKLSIKQNLSENLPFILPHLIDNDVSIRRRALDLLYLIAVPQNASRIVEELLGYLETKADPLIKDQLVLKIAILAQKFAENLIWYVDVVVRLVQSAQVQNDIWYRILQMITGFGQANSELQSYAALKLYSTLHLPHISETLKCIGAYVLSQYSEFLVNNGKQPQKIFDVLQKHFTQVNPKAKAMLLNAFIKLGIKYEQLKDQVQMICLMSSEHYDPDVQQRGVEYNQILSEDQGIKRKVLSKNPPYSEEQQASNPLLKRFAKTKVKENKNEPKKEISEFQTVNSQATVISSHPLSNHPLFGEAKDRLSAESQNLIPIPVKLEVKPYIKQALIKKTPFQGIQLKQVYEAGQGKIILSIGIKTAEMQFKIFRSPGLEVVVSPVKYGPEVQQIMLVLTPNGERIQPLSVGIAWKESTGTISKKEVQIPIFVNKFLNGVQLTREKFNEFYAEYSLKNKNYYKFDSFLKTPADVAPIQVLKKIGSFLTSVCNIKCVPFPNINNLELIFGSAMITLKHPETKANTNYPVLIEIQAYNSDKNHIRISMRGGNGNSLSGLYQLIALFFS